MHAALRLFIAHLHLHDRGGVVTLSPQELQAFATALRPVHQQFAKTIGEELLKETYAHIEKLRK